MKRVFSRDDILEALPLFLGEKVKLVDWHRLPNEMAHVGILVVEVKIPDMELLAAQDQGLLVHEKIRAALVEAVEQFESAEVKK
jgi:hypothetical protein